MAELSWLTGHLDPDLLRLANEAADRHLLRDALGLPSIDGDVGTLRTAAEALELLALDSLDEDHRAEQTREHCGVVFTLRRALPVDARTVPGRVELLRTACYGVLADQGPQAAKLLGRAELPSAPVTVESWGERVHRTLVDTWLLLLRKDGWDDLDRLQSLVIELRREQQAHEAPFLEDQGTAAHPAAWRLVALYHLARAAEILAVFLSQGSSDGGFDPREQVETHFDSAASAAERGRAVELDNLTRLLSVTAQQLLDNSLWSVARGVGFRATRLVETLVARDRPHPVFEVLPPQRRALQEEGIARAAQRSVVVSLPTSSGKTLIAQFRILQALTQFEREGGWVAYLAPTRALVNQVTRRLRRDFERLGIPVERVSPALEVDGVEASVLSETETGDRFRVLVTTPEKLDLMLRSGWEGRIGRPLVLVVVDEAHQIGVPGRGIRLELLLATINRESRYAQFMLLTPFLRNAKEIADWLDPLSSQTVEMSLDWHPNELAICLSQPVPGTGRGNWTLALKTLHTSRNTMYAPERIPIAGNRPLGLSRSAADNPGNLAAATAAVLSARGPTIVLAQQVNHTWAIAKRLADAAPTVPTSTSPRVEAVKAVLARELGEDFPLVGLIGRRVGVHHSGLPDDVRVLMEWLLEHGHLDHLVATTTVAQGVNFLVANVVLASHQYPYGQDMPPQEFWNIAGRAGRVDQSTAGVVALAAPSGRTEILERFVGNNVEALRSTLLDMVEAVMSDMDTDGVNLSRLSTDPAWSSFVQYLSHSYRMLDSDQNFAVEAERILRGTLGFRELREANRSWADQLVLGVRRYAATLSDKPLQLVDSTGFSWQSVGSLLSEVSRTRIDARVWSEDLFDGDNPMLRDMIGILLDVPELRENFRFAVGNDYGGGDVLTRMVSDWVRGTDLPTLAETYFPDAGGRRNAITSCCKELGKITSTLSWGLAALQQLTIGKDDTLDPRQRQHVSNVPAYVYYGVDDDAAVTMRMLNVPRNVATRLARVLGVTTDEPLRRTRQRLAEADDRTWARAVDGSAGPHYRIVWRMLEGIE